MDQLKELKSLQLKLRETQDRMLGLLPVYNEQKKEIEKEQTKLLEPLTPKVQEMAKTLIKIEDYKEKINVIVKMRNDLVGKMTGVSMDFKDVTINLGIKPPGGANVPTK